MAMSLCSLPLYSNMHFQQTVRNIIWPGKCEGTENANNKTKNIKLHSQEMWQKKHVLKGLCHPTRMREPMKTNLKKTAQLFQVVSEIVEGCFYLSKSQPSFDS